MRRLSFSSPAEIAWAYKEIELKVAGRRPLVANLDGRIGDFLDRHTTYDDDLLFARVTATLSRR